LLDSAKAVVKKLTLKSFDPSSIDNPQLQKHYANLQALALKRDVVDEPDDKTLPKTERMTERAGGLMKTFNELVNDVELPEVKKAAGKSAAVKRDIVKSGEDVDIEAMARAGTLAKCSVNVLSNFLKSVGASRSTGPKKADGISYFKHFSHRFGQCSFRFVEKWKKKVLFILCLNFKERKLSLDKRRIKLQIAI
jgi:ATP-dependent DNA helicase 2 subunit 1